MNVLIYNDAAHIAKATCAVFASQVITKPNSVLGFAAGSTLIPTYRDLIELYRKGIVNFSSVQAFSLEEYCELQKDHPESFRTFMKEKLFSSLNIPDENIHFLSGTAQNLAIECLDYEKAVTEAGGIDLLLLDIGKNGQISFNESGESFSSKTHIVALSKSDIQAIRHNFENADEMPKHALVMGISTVMSAKKIVVIVCGKKKAKAVRDAIKGQISPACPASILQLHPDVTIMLDNEASSMLWS